MAADQTGPRYPYNWPQYLRSDYCAEPPPIPLDWERNLTSNEYWQDGQPVLAIYQQARDGRFISSTHYAYIETMR